MSHRYPEHIADKTANRISDRAPELARNADLIRGLPAEVAYMEDFEVSCLLAGLRPDEALGDPMGLVGACTRSGAPKPEEVAVWRMWAGSRAVYRFDASLADALADTDGTAGLALDEIEAMLPLECLFIEEPIEVEAAGRLVACRGFFAMHVPPVAVPRRGARHDVWRVPLAVRGRARKGRQAHGRIEKGAVGSSRYSIRHTGNPEGRTCLTSACGGTT